MTQAIKIYLIMSSSALFAPRKILFVLQKKKMSTEGHFWCNDFFFHFSKFLKYHQTSKMPSRRFRGLQFFARRHNPYPGYQRFFLACDGELRFVGRRPKPETAHEKPLVHRVHNPLFLDSCPSSGHLIS